MRFFFIRGGLFVFYAVLIATVLNLYLCNFYFNNWDNVSNLEKDFWVAKIENKQIDLAVFGSSRAFYSVDPNEICSQNSAVFNFGTNASSHADHYLFLETILNHNNTIKNILLQVDPFSISSNGNSFSLKEYVFIPKVDSSPYDEVYEENQSVAKRIAWQLPLVPYLEYNNYYRINYFRTKYPSAFDDTRGYEALQTEIFNKESFIQKTKLEVSEKNIKYIHKFIEKAKKRGIRVFLFTSPVYGPSLENYLNYKELLYEINLIARNNRINYLNYFSLEGYQDSALFFDSQHLNHIGALMLSEKLNKDLNLECVELQE